MRFILVVFIILSLGCASQEFIASNKNLSHQANPVVRNYYESIRKEIKDNVLILYYKYSRWEDSGEARISFTVHSDGKLGDFSVSLSKAPSDEQILRNIATLGLKKAFPIKVFPKDFKEYDHLKFHVPIFFKNDGPLKKKKLLPHHIGVSISDINDDIRAIYDLDLREGVFISNVYDDGPAFKAGLKPGDIIYSANGQVMKTIKDLVRFTKEASGDIALTTNRGIFLVKKEVSK